MPLSFMDLTLCFLTIGSDKALADRAGLLKVNVPAICGSSVLECESKDRATLFDSLFLIFFAGCQGLLHGIESCRGRDGI